MSGDHNRYASINQIKSDGSTAKYYELPDNATELQDLISCKNMNYSVGSIFALCYDYCKTHRESVRVVKEIVEHADREIARLQGLQDLQKGKANI